MSRVKIMKKYDHEMKQFEISIGEAKDFLEDRGYYKNGTVREIVDAGENISLFTPWAVYSFIFEEEK